MLLGYLIFALPPAALVSGLTYLPWYLHIRGSRGKLGALYHLPRYALTGCVLSLLYLTILWYWPDITFHPERRFLNLRPFAWLTVGYEMGMGKAVGQVLTNIVMFVPYGFLLPVAAEKLRGFRATALVVLGTTLTIEILQYFMGRSADIDDVLTNFLGGLLGWGIFALLGRRFGSSPRWRRMLGEA